MDARIRYTKKVIREEFIKLLSKTNISKITVSEICKNADINRATFYKYYDNPYDLLVKTESELLDDLQTKIEQLEDRNFVTILRTVLRDLQENISIYTVIFSKNGDLAFRERLFSLCYQENMVYINDSFPDISDIHKEWLYDFVLEGCNGIINNWISGGMKESIDDIVDFTKSISKTLHQNLGNYI